MQIFKRILKSKITIEIVAIIAALYAYLVRITSVVKYENKDAYLKLKKGGDSLICVTWHGRIIFAPLVFASLRRNVYSLVSTHRDGEIITRYLHKFNSQFIRGSTNSKGTEALRQILKILRIPGSRICIIPDGPRGPNMEIGGALMDIARISGKTIIAMSYSAKRARFANSWDQLLIPSLFNHITIKFTDPISIPKNADAKEISLYKKKLEDSLNEITWELDRKYNHPKVVKGKQNIKNDKDI